MFKIISVLSMVICLFTGSLMAQPAEEAQTKDDSPAESAPNSEAAPPEPAPTGDVITLKTGKEIKNVQVLRSSPAGYEIEIVPGVVMTIARKQVVSIAYDDIDPRKTRRTTTNSSEDKGQTATPLVKTSPELIKKLNNPVTQDKPKSLNGVDCIQALQELAQVADVPLEFTEAVRGLAEAERAWTTTIPPMSPMRAVLEGLPVQLPKLEVGYDQFDKVVIRLKGIMNPPEAPVESVEPPVAPTPPPVQQDPAPSE